MVDRSDLVPAALSQDVLTVFQFHSYILLHEVQDMETHLLHLAREGEQKGVWHFKIHFVQIFIQKIPVYKKLNQLSLSVHMHPILYLHQEDSNDQFTVNKVLFQHG